MDNIFNSKFRFLDYIIANEMFIVCPPKSTDRFVDFCKKRGINTSRKQLEKLEKLGVLFPVARVEYPKISKKIEYIDDGTRYNDLGILLPDETWNGAIKEEYSHFWFKKDYAKEWREEGLLWDPAERSFQDWDKFKDENGRTFIESFYSIFQCYALFNLNKITTVSLQYENIVTYTNEILMELMGNIRKSAEQTIKAIQEKGVRGNNAPFISQIISNRFYPKTQTDRRTFNISKSSLYHDWDWVKYCSEWDSKATLNELSIEPNMIKNAQELLALDASNCDPLQQWYDLVNFVSVSKKRKLKENALLAQTIYSMEMMMRLLYEDLTGTGLNQPHEGMGWKVEDYYGDDVLNDDLMFLEFLSNEYHLNPKPSVIIIVEGDGEEEQFPRLLKELFGFSITKLGLEIRNVKGIGNFEGKKRQDPYGAFEKYIDDYHRRGTIVFVILDREGNVEKIRNKLIKKKSEFFSNRTVTKQEYFHIWDKDTIEFDNFAYEEIARAMTELTEGNYTFSKNEIETCYVETKRGKGNMLGEIYKKKLDYDLNKPKLLDILFSQLIADSKNERTRADVKNRPVVKLLDKIILLALRNHQPVTHEIYLKNQQSDYFGDLF